MDNQELKIQELEERVSNLEKTTGHGPRKFIWITLSIILGLSVILMLIGVLQFVSNG
ncbi:hypothetical protein [Paenibacillus tepidiphilus]|uniref:hypothetical protein n=1 Tax=Paenibacillus tepidiphilus TaxID=2608683 RepID=UPI00193EAF8B|nr:hypothetical protein [Paenibacillus tepidiphilus]